MLKDRLARFLTYFQKPPSCRLGYVTSVLNKAPCQRHAESLLIDSSIPAIQVLETEGFPS